LENDDFAATMADLDTNDAPVTKRGKNAKTGIVAYGINFDSNEELEFYEWILEAKELGFVDDFEYQPKSFVLFDGAKNSKGKFTVRPHVYTADFRIEFNDSWIDFKRRNSLKLFDGFDEMTVYVDTKGAFNRFSGGDERVWSINCKWTLAKFGIYVHKVIPKKFFGKAWLPKRCVFTRKTKKISTRYKDFKTFENRSWAKKA